MERISLTSATNTDGSVPVTEWEKRASDIVLVIQKCTGCLRNVKEFASLSPAALWTAVKYSKNAAPIHDNQNKNINAIITTTDLYSKLEEGRILSEVDSCCQFQDNKNGKCPHTENSDSRTKLTYGILLPLAKGLSECYDYLDQVPPHAKAPEPLSQRKSSRAKQQPPPPPGMLSLQNYTDVGAFAEFIVCTSILPLLEPCILFSAEDRARYFLPKSLAGRISKPSLLWGCRQTESLAGTADIERLRKAVQELQSTVIVLGHLLLLDRFRPMLLPRHLADLYAAILQSEAYDMRLQHLSKISSPDNQNKGSTESGNTNLLGEFNDVVAVLLPDLIDGESIMSRHASARRAEKQSVVPVDPGLQAQALQTLLLHGTKSPLWLRQRVSKRLTDIACHNLSVIVQVFVHAAPPKDKAAASARLARTLVSPSQKHAEKGVLNSKQTTYYDLLCRQLINLLDHSVDESIRQNSNTKELTAKETLNIHTVWNIMDQLPLEEMHRHMSSLLSEGMLDYIAGTTIHRSVRRIGALLSSVPPSFDPSKISRIFLLPLQRIGHSRRDTFQLEGTKMTILGALIRLAAVSPSVLKSELKEDVVWVTRMLLHVLMDSRFTVGRGEDGVDEKSKWRVSNEVPAQTADPMEVVAMALFYSIAPSSWDLSGYIYACDPNATTASSPTDSTLDCITIKRQEDPFKNAQDLVYVLESRVELVLKEMVAPLVRQTATMEEKEIRDGAEAKKHNNDNLPSVMFHLTLLLYFTAIASQHQRSSNLPTIFLQPENESVHHFFRVISMCMLPLLCENFQPESLLMGGYDGGSGILKMMKLVFSCAASYFTSDAQMDSLSEKERAARALFFKTQTDNSSHECFRESGCFLSRVLLGLGDRLDSTQACVSAAEARKEGLTSSDFDSAEMLMSVTSLLLSLLIAILELGTEVRRSVSEEEILSSFPPLLRPLAEASDLPWIRELDDGNHESAKTLSASCAEIAEMAAHVVALLMAREAPRTNQVDNDKNLGTTTTHGNMEDIVLQTIREAESDLKSTQPPIRARGVVSLQRMLRGPLFDTLLAQGAAASSNKSLVVEIEEVNTPSESLLDKAVNGVLRVSMLGMSDVESYVFLAAIQSIVVAADLCPSKVLPLIAEALVSGVLIFNEGDHRIETMLTAEQRVKLAEALMFCIRRRARIDEFITTIMDMMIFGHGRETEIGGQYDTKAVDQIQEETLNYFFLREVTESGDLHGEVDLEEKAEKQNLRFNTGGPLFRAEEVDVVTAARITVVSELVATAHPTVVSKYCAVVVRIGTESLRLDASRPVRRAAAFLAREIYRSLLREHVDMLEAMAETAADSEFSPALALATALISPQDNDAILASALRRCVSADDLGDVSSRKYRVFDEATSARCQEALDARRQVVDGGLLAVARMIAKTKELHDSRPVNRVIRGLLGKGTGDTVKAMHGLKIDAENLVFK